MSIWLRSLAIFSAILSICFLGRSDIRRILCFLNTQTWWTIEDGKLTEQYWMEVAMAVQRADYLAVAVPKRTAYSWYLFTCFSMKLRWLLTPQTIIWSLSRTCICAPSLSFCILFCPNDSQKDDMYIKRVTPVFLIRLTLNCSVIVLNRRE